MMPVRTTRDVPRLALFAKRDIQPMEELTFHYGGDDNDRSSKSQTKREASRVDGGDVACLCGTASCQSVLPFDESLF